MTLPAPAPPRRRTWLLAIAVAWAVVLAAVAYASVRRDPPTVRDQRSIEQARPIVDRAVGELAAAGGSDVVLHISGYEVTDGCRITPFRSGQTLGRDVTIYTGEADGPALLDRLAKSLPPSYGARTRHAKEQDTLRADAGEFVTVRGSVTAPGVVVVSVGTGCRPGADLDAAPPQAEPGAVEPVLSALGVTPSEVTTAEAPCPDGGTVRTVEASGDLAGTPPTPLPRPAGATVVLDTPELLAYRTASTSASIELNDSVADARITTPC
ncbi:hypothetical protein [Phytohabitans rumicis]|uniref:Uncharacterized protein n=1 Tax=Phytohabitans rumicis TaxID=1076125 RepID=A0A6V8L5Y8_9ACTN|nr:hypothetical protein [Phytohabitans rumicis]GFJ91020.1 hypothetical protein Prum_046620 [Phytohabitans rumicis]